ncbi:hypothetical protein DV532_28760 (plasmid) [Pseudomonas sp. Leaf58]|nr:hypothetical protein DV532_28760 [Pseudomonas sp. Leaf58]
MACICRYSTFFLFCLFSVLVYGSPVQGVDERKQVTLAFLSDAPEIALIRDGLASNPGLEVNVTSVLDKSLCVRDSELVVWGSDAGSKIASQCPNKKLVVISSRYMVSLMKNMYSPDTWGYYMDQPVALQVKHADLNMPSIRTLGILYNKNDIELPEIKKIMATPHRMEIKMIEIQDNQVVAQVMRDLYQSVDAVLITGNKQIWSLQDFKTYLVLGMRQNKIMIGGYNYLYTNRGSISSVHTDFTALGAKIGAQIIDGSGKGFNFFEKYKIVTNELLAARYGIYIGSKKE